MCQFAARAQPCSHHEELLKYLDIFLILHFTPYLPLSILCFLVNSETCDHHKKCLDVSFINFTLTLSIINDWKVNALCPQHNATFCSRESRRPVRLLRYTKMTRNSLTTFTSDYYLLFGGFFWEGGLLLLSLMPLFKLRMTSGPGFKARVDP